jgi:hypothetical protein
MGWPIIHHLAPLCIVLSVDTWDVFWRSVMVAYGRVTIALVWHLSSLRCTDVSSRWLDGLPHLSSHGSHPSSACKWGLSVDWMKPTLNQWHELHFFVFPYTWISDMSKEGMSWTIDQGGGRSATMCGHFVSFSSEFLLCSQIQQNLWNSLEINIFDMLGVI